MALNPFQSTEDRFEEIEVEVQPSKTYWLDYENGRIGGLIDDEDAIRQFIIKAIKTARYRFLIYDDQYGSELDDLIGQDVTQGFLDSEIPRIITEALIYDERVASVDNFVITKTGDKVFVSFTVTLTDDTEIGIEEVAI